VEQSTHAQQNTLEFQNKYGHEGESWKGNTFVEPGDPERTSRVIIEEGYRRKGIEEGVEYRIDWDHVFDLKMSLGRGKVVSLTGKEYLELHPDPKKTDAATVWVKREN